MAQNPHPNLKKIFYNTLRAGLRDIHTLISA